MLKYTSILKSRPYFYKELKHAGALVLKGFSIKEIKSKAVEENIFSVESETRKKEVASSIAARLKILDHEMLEFLTAYPLSTSKQVALVAIMKTDRLFYEFMNEVYREKISLGDKVLTDKDFNTFFRRKIEQDEKIASWKDYTFYKMKQVYKRILSEASFTKGKGKEVELVQQIMEEDVVKHLKKTGDEEIIKIVLGEH